MRVVQLREDDIEQAASILTSAFFTYPLWTWLFPDEAVRRELLPSSARVTMRWGVLMGETYGTAPLTGVAVWMPPGTPGDIDPDGTLTGWPAWEERAGPDVTAKMEAMATEQRAARERAHAGRAWYLPWLGVDPGAQRSGAGSALLQHIFARTDAAALPVLLETEKAENVPYYERHGFFVTHEGVIPMGGPLYWTMKRDPRH